MDEKQLAFEIAKELLIRGRDADASISIAKDFVEKCRIADLLPEVQ